jgi:pimeloyl-ACP methyl ester carboxylesterase
MTSMLTTPEGRRIAFNQTPGRGPGVVFLGGFRSDMEGTKALWLEQHCRARGRAFLRFDYSGHGASSGRFEDACIGDWVADAMAALSLTNGPQVLVGSSMGGWIALRLARAMPERVAALVGIASAPDFTEDSLWAGTTGPERAEMAATGRILRSSAYSTEPYVFTRHLIEDGRRQLVLRSALHLPFPVRLLQGTSDEDVPVSVALRLLDHATGPDIRLTLVKGADHRFSTPECLALIGQSVEDVSSGVEHA